MRDKRIICDRKKLYKSGKLLVTAGIFSAVIFGVSTTNNTGVTVSQATDKVTDTTATTDKVADTTATTDKVADTTATTDKVADTTAT
ncbi:MAG: KxYKxGKxW signal peptide domain-containing protein, partial [Leuconostoc mesenteroides]